MAIVVLGDNPQAWLVAALAGLTSGEPIALTSPGLPADVIELSVSAPGRRGTARVLTGSKLPLDVGDPVVIVAPEIDEGRALASSYLPSLVGRIVVLAPSGAGGAISVADLFDGAGLACPTLAETTGFPALGSMTAGVAEISTVKDGLPIAALQADQTASVVAAMAPYLPRIVATVSILATSLANTNNIVHPPLTLINAARIDAGSSFTFYREGLTRAGTRAVEAVDAERLLVTDRLGLPHVSIAEWFARFYGRQGMAGSDVGEMLGTFPPLAGSQGPTRLRHRYLIDDIGTGLAVIEAVGHELGFDMPVTGAICTVGSQLVDQDLRVGARSLARRLLELAAPANEPPGSGKRLAAHA